MLGKTVVAGTLLAFASVALAADLSGLNLDAVPQCGLVCISRTVAEKSSCSPTDFPCICANVALQGEIEACFAAECTPRDALTTAKLAKDLCGLPKRNRELSVWLVPVVFIALSTIFYFLRLVSRVVLHQGLDIADVVLGGGVAFTFPLLWVAFKLSSLGLGKDVWEVIPQENITQILHYYWWAELLYHAGLQLTRISIICFYLKVFPHDYVRRACFALIGLNIANFIAFEIATVFQCYPIYGAWTLWDGTFQGHCNDIHLQGYIQGAFNTALDLLVIALPLIPLSRLTVSRRKKVQLMVMFSLGLFVTAISVARLTTLVVFANSTNISYDYVGPGLYSIVEASVSIIICCLPTTRALCVSIFPKLCPPTAKPPRIWGGNVPRSAYTPQRFSRIEDAYFASDNTNNTLGAREEWSGQNSNISNADTAIGSPMSPVGDKPWTCQSSNVSKAGSSVELMAMDRERIANDARNGLLRDGATRTLTIKNWSRPLPCGREAGGFF